MATQIFVNLAVRNLERTMGFFSSLGFKFNPQFTDENAACMIVNDKAFVMFLVKPFFKTFTSKSLVDASKSSEVLLSLSADSKAKVNEIMKTALDLGATETRDLQDHGFMFGRSFNDLDGHIWEIAWMDTEAMSEGQ